jgi:hypothetical protein
VNGAGAAVVVVAAIVAVVAMLAVTVRSQRRVRHRIEEALGRLGVEGALHGRGLEDVLGRFERVIEQAEGERGSARRRAGRLASALAAVPQGVVV